MRNILFFFVAVLLIFSCKNKEIAKRLDNLYQSEDFFEFNRVLLKNIKLLATHEQLYYESMALNLLNKPLESNKLIEQLINKYQSKFSDTILTKIYETKACNECFLFEYKAASQTTNYILRALSSSLSKSRLEDIKEDSAIYQALVDCEKQTIVIPNDYKVSLIRDKVGLMNIPVKGTDTISHLFIFDTGANFSTLTESIAMELNLKVFNKKIKVKAMGGEAEVNIGTCPVLKIGNATLQNVSFLIFPDSALYFKEVDYQVNGVIGFPIMNALKQFTITANDLCIYKQETTRNFQNLLLNGLQPMIELEFKGVELPFNFDSGANKTDLFVAFYEKYKNDPSFKFRDTIISSGGGAGVYKFKVKRIDSIQFKTANKQFVIRDVNIHTSDKILPSSAKSYGNIGQDFIHNYKSMTINFDKMYVDFE